MKSLTDIIFILDESGSMSPLQKDVVGSFETFIKEQKEIEGEARLTLVTFSGEPRTLYSATDIQGIEELKYNPSGSTALYDAIGQAINNEEKKLAETNKSKRPDKIIVVILTDGEENASRNYNNKQIKDMITHLQAEHNWEFVYLGANQDSFAVGQTIGVTFTSNYRATTDGIFQAQGAISNAVSYVRTADKTDSKMLQDLLDQASKGTTKAV